MLDDFSTGPVNRPGVGRLSVSTLAATAVLAAFAAFVVMTADPPREPPVRGTVTRVSIDWPPKPPPVELPRLDEPPEPEPGPRRRGTQRRPAVAALRDIPAEAPVEEDGQLEEGPGFHPETEGDPDGDPDARGVGGGGSGSGFGAPLPILAPPPPPRPARRGPVRLPENATPPDCDRPGNRPPVSPPELRAAGVPMIRVVARVTIDADGAVADVEVLRGHPLLPDAHVVSALRTWRCTPARLNGEPLSVTRVQPLAIAVTL